MHGGQSWTHEGRERGRAARCSCLSAPGPTHRRCQVRVLPAPPLLQPAQAGAGRRFKVGAMALRTWWFDRHILEELGALHSARRPVQALPSVQVVLLGAGMDTRPWRLEGVPQGP